MSPPFPYAGEISAAVSSLCWATSGIVFMRIRPQPSAGTMNLGKNLTATTCFLVLLLILNGRPWPTSMRLDVFLLFAASGVIGLAVCDLILFRAFLLIGPRRTNVYMAMWPAMAAVLAMPPPLGETPAFTVWIGMTVTLCGVVLAVLERGENETRRALLLRGARLALVAALLQSVGILIAREAHRVGGDPVADGATIRLAAGTVGLVLIGLASGRLRQWGRQLARPAALWRLVVAGFIATFLGIWTNQAGLAWAEHTAVAATLNALAPIWLIPLSIVFLGEEHDLRAWISALLAVGGIALMMIA